MSAIMRCRLCIKNSHDFLYIFDEDGKQMGIADILALHFWFKPQPNDQPSASVCFNCWLKIIEFHDFYLRIKQTQAKFNNCDVTPKNISPDFLPSEFIDVDSTGDSVTTAIETVEERVIETNYPIGELYYENCEAEEIDENIIQTYEELDDDDDNMLARTPDCLSQGEVEDVEERNENPKKARLCVINTIEEDDEMVKKYIPMNCPFCPYVGDDFLMLRKHFRKEHPSQTKIYVQCCNKRLFRRRDVIHHAYRHDNPEFIKCMVCQKIFAEKASLSRHMIATHPPEEELNFYCEDCPKKFTRQKQLDLHRDSHVPMDERTFVCDQCPNSRFASNYLLKVHISMQHKKPVNVCHVCAKEIRSKTSFDRHVRQHFEKNRPKLKCPIADCDRWLKDELNLQRHMRLHTTEPKNIKCDKCGRPCKDRAALSNHKRRVHPDVLHECEQCKKTFKRAIYLEEHMTRHTGKILYKCLFCTRTFNSNSNMHSHKNKMHAAEWNVWRKTNKGSFQDYSRITEEPEPDFNLNSNE